MAEGSANNPYHFFQMSSTPTLKGGVAYTAVIRGLPGWPDSPPVFALGKGESRQEAMDALLHNLRTDRIVEPIARKSIGYTRSIG